MIAKISGPGQEISRYEISDREMAAGSTLGAPKATLLIKATGAIDKLFSVEAGTDAFGTLVLHHWDARSGIPLVAAPGEFIIHPHHQEHVFELSNGAAVREDLFVLSGAPRGRDLHEVDPPAAYYAVEVRNEGKSELEIATYASIRLRGGFEGGTRTAYDSSRHAFVVRNEEMPDFVRLVCCSKRPASYETTLDAAKPSLSTFAGPLSNETLELSDDPIGIFHLSHRLRAGECAEFRFVLTFSLAGEADAKRTASALPSAVEALKRTTEHYESVLDRAVVVTPDSEVNRGVLWAKTNMLRVQALTGQGWCFTNDPTRSNNSVARDTAWFGFGSDYITPHFSRESLQWYAGHTQADGMVVEYFDIRNGKTENYGLNINDDTPLIVLALWHHYGITGDREFLSAIFPKVEQSARYILSQRNGEGLVWCSADGTGDWGIAGWRNVIQGYRLSGATTELNSECYAALKTVALMAAELGDSEKAQFFSDKAKELRNAINEHLLDKERSLYYLNIGLDGQPHTDVTSDLVFPVMFGVADHDIAANIIARLSIPEFWSDAGLHTVPRNDINYGPTQGYGLLGGVWSGPTFWYAFAASGFNPEFMAYALSMGFKHYSADPKRNNTVPGQFCEWLHGETLTNQGMMLSPWFAPKYAWAALEGAAGLDLSGPQPDLKPRPASAWHWIGVHNLRLRGKDVSWFAVRTPELRVYANYPFPSVDPGLCYEDDITDDVYVSGDAAVRLALRSGRRMAIFIGNTGDRTITTSLTVNGRHLRKKYMLRIYNTLTREWTERRHFDAEVLHRGFPVQINDHGFSIAELHEEPA